ncbi:MAG: methyl-accepting chemotaxis protein [Acetatifactor sp.]|nr:methyl-accepting chemotaxis protein [Acetatifactor sp.]
MIVVGIIAYQKASEGMSRQFLESAEQTINMANTYLDAINNYVEGEAKKYAASTDLNSYFSGAFEGADNTTTKLKLLNSTKDDLLSAQLGNHFINNLYVIPQSGLKLVSTVSSMTTQGFFEECREEAESKSRDWVDRHAVVDGYMGVTDADYIMSYQIMSKNEKGMIIIDIKPEAIQEFLQELVIGEGSYAAFVTENGREIVVDYQGSYGGAGEVLLYQETFYQECVEECIATGEAVGNKEVVFGGQEYLFIYSWGEDTGAMICMLVPRATIMGQADQIKAITIVMVVLAILLAGIIGIIITISIRSNMKRISTGLEQVADGDLTGSVKVSGRDEFGDLAQSANHMIQNNKKLVSKVHDATGQLELSANEVKSASEIISDYSLDITQAITEINAGMSRQSVHAQECVEKTGLLSDDMQEVSQVVEKVEMLVQETDAMIHRGMEIIELLGRRAQETTDITNQVGSSIEQLSQETESINIFAETITGISEQTNLLSLNASIEAARAGEAGRGFAVVAEEIRKLADDSARAAGEISNHVQNISTRTTDSVQSAKQAEEMVALQGDAVQEVIQVFANMRDRMQELVTGLQDIVASTEQADKERAETLQAVQNISQIIAETAGNAEIVSQTSEKLMENVDNLSRTADALGSNMNELKTEIAMFKT